MKDNLIVINKYKELINLYYKTPKKIERKYYSLKDRIENLLLENLKELYIINSSSNKPFRIQEKENMLGKLKYLNYLLDNMTKLEMMNEKQYKVLYIKIEEIYKCLIGWLKFEK